MCQTLAALAGTTGLIGATAALFAKVDSRAGKMLVPCALWMGAYTLFQVEYMCKECKKQTQPKKH